MGGGPEGRTSLGGAEFPHDILNLACRRHGCDTMHLSRSVKEDEPGWACA